ncbi:MAG: hypothetical protein KAX19_04310, partial [Candidatus Brocadiae bacterium]|nr:hypothetical protein [Candidatus Brocadiia bacterium]
AYAVWSKPTALRDRRLILGCFLIVLAGLSLYAYLPLASAADPPINWGEPTTWGRFWFHVTRAGYRSVDFAAGVSVRTKLQFVGHFLGLLWRQFTPFVLVPFGLLGIWFMKGRPRAFVLFGGVFALNSFVLLMILQFDYEPDNLTRVEEYYLPAYLCAAVFIAGGLSLLTGRLERPSRMLRTAAVALCAAVPIVPLAAHWRANDMSGYYLAHDFNKLILESLEPDAVYFPQGDYSGFPCIYLQVGEGVRRDVILANVSGHLGPEAQEYLAGLDPTIRADELGKALATMVVRGRRPVYVRSLPGVGAGGYRISPWGLVYRVRRADAPPLGDPPDVFGRHRLRDLSAPRPRDEMDRLLLSLYHLMWAENLMAGGQTEE